MAESTVELKEILDVLTEELSAKLFRGDNGESCITINDDSKQKTFILSSSQWRDWFIQFVRKREWGVSSYLRDELIEELLALASVHIEQVNVRIGRTEEAIQIDLNDDSYNVVSINEKGFRVQQPKNVHFLRPNKQQPLPIPIKTDKKIFIPLLQTIFPVSFDMLILILTFMLKAIDRDRGSFAHLVVEGPQGSGKSMLSKRIKALIDPASPCFFSSPKDVSDILVASVHSYLLVFDNLSGLTHFMADVFCRLSTGGGLSKRKLYFDHEEMFYKLHRSCILNGIDEPSNRPDFLDRCITVQLKEFKNKNRVAESELDRQFEENRPQLLGGLYGLLSECLRVLPSIPNNNLPRMTDFCRMGLALEKVLKLAPGSFMEAYEKNRSEQTENAFWGDELCCAIFDRLQREEKGAIEGTAHSLMGRLFRDRRKTGGPRSPRAFSGWLKRVEPLLKTKGILVKRLPRTADERTIRIYFKNPPERKEVSYEY
ncbi:MAG: hypothetical protein V4596_14140 [Bdellovibrionota bacterium]